MSRGIYLSILICVFFLAISFPAFAITDGSIDPQVVTTKNGATEKSACEFKMTMSLNDFVRTAALESDAPVTLIAANKPNDAEFRDAVAALVKQAAKANSYRFLSESPAKHPKIFLGDLIAEGTETELLNEMKTQAGRYAFIVLNIDSKVAVSIDKNNDLILTRRVVENLHRLAAQWKSEGVNVRFFVTSRLHMDPSHEEYLKYTVQPVMSPRSGDYIPGYYDAVSAPTSSPRFVNIGTQTLVITYPN